MAIMPQIAMGFQTPQIQLPNQGNMLMQVAQLQQMQEANALRQAQARKLQLDEERGNALAQVLRSGQPTFEQFMVADPGRGADVYKAFQDAQKAKDADLERKRKAVMGSLYSMYQDPSSPAIQQSVRFLQEQSLTDPQMEEFFSGLTNLGEPARKQQLMTLIRAIPGGAEYVRGVAQQEANLAKTGAETEKAQAEARKAERPAEPPMTEFARLIAERNALPLGPERALYDARLERFGQGPVTKVDVNTGEKIEEKASIESAVREQDRVRTAAQTARRTLVAADSTQRLLDEGFKTGFGTESKAAVAAFLGAFGVKDAEKFATDAQTFLKAAMDQVLARQIEQRGVQTNQDAQRMLQTYADLGNTLAANRFVVALTRAQANQAVEQDEFYRKWKKDKGTIQGAEDAWLEQQGNKSIFERPELKQYAPKKDAPTPLPDVINFKDLRPR